MIATSLPRRGGIRTRNCEPVPPGPARDAESRHCRKIAPPVAGPPPGWPSPGRPGNRPARPAVRRGRSSRPSRRCGGICARTMRSARASGRRASRRWPPIDWGCQRPPEPGPAGAGAAPLPFPQSERAQRQCIQLSDRTHISRRLRIAHQHGIVIHSAAVIGDDCLIRHGVTIGGLGGSRAGRSAGAPRLGDRVGVGCARAASRRGTAARRAAAAAPRPACDPPSSAAPGPGRGRSDVRGLRTPGLLRA